MLFACLLAFKVNFRLRALGWDSLYDIHVSVSFSWQCEDEIILFSKLVLTLRLESQQTTAWRVSLQSRCLGLDKEHHTLINFVRLDSKEAERKRTSPSTGSIHENRIFRSWLMSVTVIWHSQLRPVGREGPQIIPEQSLPFIPGRLLDTEHKWDQPSTAEILYCMAMPISIMVDNFI